jgi:tungstate transport system ATP-binding protein
VDSLLEIKNVSLSLEKAVILDRVNLSVEKGEVLVLLGPNGAGKSTLLQIAAGLLKPTSGSVYFTAAPDLHDLAYRRKISTVFQSPLLLSDTVENNVACGLKFRGDPPKEIREKVDLWMEQMHISHLRKRRAKTLSGGEAQRVSLARAFCLETELVLMDEPFSALDAPTRQELLDDLRSLFSRTRQTCMYVTHDLEEGLTLADRIAILFNGKLHQLDTAHEVFTRPSTREVASFMGVDNIIHGKVVGNQKGLLQIQSDHSLIEAVGNLKTGAAVYVCLRPEDITLFPAGRESSPSTARNRIRCTITHLGHQGPFIRIQLDAGFKLVALVTRPSAQELGLEVGREVEAAFKATAIHLLPAGKNA